MYLFIALFQFCPILSSRKVKIKGFSLSTKSIE